jgi:hypothetical protein
LASDLEGEPVLLLADDVAPLAVVSAFDVPSERLALRELELFLPLGDPSVSPASFLVLSVLL